MTRLAFSIHENPIPKKRARHGRNGSVYTPQETIVWEKTVALHARLALYEYDSTMHLFEGELGIVVTFYRQDKVRVDADNLLKSIKDACNLVLYKDDSQITGELVRLYRGCKLPRVDVLLMPIHDFDVLTTGIFNEQLKVLPE